MLRIWITADAFFILMVLTLTALPRGEVFAAAEPAVVLFAGTPTLVSIGDWKFLNATLQKYYPGTDDLILFSLWKNSIGQTVSVTTGGTTMTAGEVANCYAPVFGVPPGNYRVLIFIVDTNNNPLSLALTVQVSITSNQ